MEAHCLMLITITITLYDSAIGMRREEFLNEIFNWPETNEYDETINKMDGGGINGRTRKKNR